MWNSFRSLCFVSVTILLLFNIPLICSATTPSPESSLQLTITFHYGVVTVHGKLENAIIYPNNSLSMMMRVNDQVVVHGSSSQVMMNGTLNGMRSGSTLSGQIVNLMGASCIQTCWDMTYVGKGQWSGTLNQTHGAGTFQGTVTITQSPIDYVPIGETAPFTGTWSADFA